MLIAENVEDGETSGAGDRIAAEGREKFHAVGEGRRDFGSGDDSGKRKGVADRLAKDHDVRNDLLRFKSPKVSAQAAKTDLNFVGYADAAVCANVVVNFSEIIRRKDDLAGNAGKSFRDVSGNAPPIPFQRREDFGDVSGVFFAQVRFAATIETAVVVGDGSDVDPGLSAAPTGPIEFVRADVDERVGVAMVGVLQDQDIFTASVSASDAESEFVGFATGIDEIADAERRGKERSEALGVTIGVVVEIARVGVEDGELVLYGANDTRMRVADEGDIIVDVEKSAASVVEEILLRAANDFQGMSVGDAQISAEEGAAGGEGFVE